MAKQRSPNYPALDLESAIRDARALYTKEGRTPVPPDVAVKAWQYTSLSGVARTRLAALKQYGLVQWERGNVKVTDRALTLILRQPESREWQAAVRAAALDPEIFSELYESYAEASDDALRTHLIRDKNFTQDGASRLISAFRATLGFAKLDSTGYIASADEGRDQEQVEGEAYRNGGYETAGSRVHSYRWPLSKNVVAELRLTGTNITARDLEMLRKYLELAESALSADTEDRPDREESP